MRQIARPASARRTRFVRSGLITTLALGATLAQSGNWNVPTESRDLKNPVAIDGRSIAQARNLYTLHCVDCHGPQGAGDGARSRVDYDLRTIVDPLTDGELYWKITHGVGKMPSFAGTLNDRERWLMVNYLRHLRAQADSK
ncbi:MAG TPA: cytochrome c [Steroidobacteraceae bacterium]|nr:cytochrome c [Steroidobacteraceae bacterium]